MRGEARGQRRPFIARELVIRRNTPERPFRAVYEVRKVYATKRELELRLVGLKPPNKRAVRIAMDDPPPAFRSPMELYVHAR